MRLPTKRQLLRAWTPAALQPVCWFEARRGAFTTISPATRSLADNDTVGYWRDLSKFGSDLSAAADDTTRPTLQGTSAFPYLNFDGSNDILRRLGGNNLYTGGAASMFAAIRSNSNAASAILVAEGYSGNTNDIYSLIGANNTTASSLSGLIRNDAGTSLLPATTVLQTSVHDGNDRVVGGVDNGTTATPWFDGTQGAATTYTARTGTLTGDRFAVGGLWRTTAASWFAARVYAVVVIPRALSISEAKLLSTYLGRLQGRVI